MLGGAVEIIPQTSLNIASIEETGKTFHANALLKARHAARESGLPALADDSGLQVDALQGAPGVFSARYAGVNASDADNVAKLLDALHGVPSAQRTARFSCVLAFVREAEDPTPIYAVGNWEGSIALQPSGTNGFGYDPVFIDAELGLTSAELESQQKNVRSHRGKALAQLHGLLSGIRMRA